MVAQFEQALGNLLTALRAAGGEPEHLASLTIYIVDMDDYRAHAAEIGQVWRRLVGRDYPAMAGIGVARLWDAEALVEVQGFAVLPDPGSAYCRARTSAWPSRSTGPATGWDSPSPTTCCDRTRSPSAASSSCGWTFSACASRGTRSWARYAGRTGTAPTAGSGIREGHSKR